MYARREARKAGRRRVAKGRVAKGRVAPLRGVERHRRSDTGGAALATRHEAYKLLSDACCKHVVDPSATASAAWTDVSLVEAVLRRDAGRLGLLLARGVDPNADRSHVLCVAAVDGSVQLLRLLLDAGADVHARRGLPLVLAVDGGHLGAARLLLDRGAAPDALNGEALRLATRYGRQDIADLLLQRGAAPVAGPPATLPSGDGGQNAGGAPGDDSNKENGLP